jgi:hypothetical protein
MQPPYVSGGVTARQMVARRPIRDRIDDPLEAVLPHLVKGHTQSFPVKGLSVCADANVARRA